MWSLIPKVAGVDTMVLSYSWISMTLKNYINQLISKCSRNFWQILIQSYDSLIFTYLPLLVFEVVAWDAKISMYDLAESCIWVQNSFSLKLQMHKSQTSANSMPEKSCSWFTVIWQWAISWESRSIMLEVLLNESRTHYHEVKCHKCKK